MKNIYIIFIIIFIQGCDTPTTDTNEKILSVKVVNSIKQKSLSKEGEKLRRELIGDYMDEKSASKYLTERKKLLPKLKKMSLIELLNNVKTLPDGGELLPRGDYYSEEIINRGDKVVPLLIEASLNQEVISKVSYYESLNYFIRDVAVNLIPYASNNKFRLEKFFFKDDNNSDRYIVNPHVFNQTYVKFFFKYSDDNLIMSNKVNHLILYTMLKKWEKERYKD